MQLGISELVVRNFFAAESYAMKRDDLLRRKAEIERDRAEIEREFAEIQGQIAAWVTELTPVGVIAVPAVKRDRKKYTSIAVVKRGRREESKRAAVAHVAEIMRRAPLEVKEEKFETPVWIRHPFRNISDMQLTIPEGYPNGWDPYAMAREFEGSTTEEVLRAIRKLRAIKVMLGMTCTLRKDGTRDLMVLTKWGVMTALTNADADAAREFFDDSFAYVNEEFENYCVNGSGWTIESVDKLDLQIVQYRPGRGGSHMESPAWIVAKKCCINVKNKDQDCFRYALTAAVDRPAANAERPSYYNKPERRNLFNLSGIDMPAKCCSRTFQRFEAQNPKYSLLVWQCPMQSASRGDLFPAYISPHEDRERIILVLLYEGEAESEETAKSHYITVSNVNALLRVDSNYEAHCLRCLHTFAGANSKANLERHMQNPCGNKVCEFPTPGKNDMLKFDDFDKKLKVPYAIYADFEAGFDASVKKKLGKSTERLNEHIANSYTLTTTGPGGGAIKKYCQFYRGGNPALHFLETAQRIAEELKTRMQKFRIRPPLSELDEGLWVNSEYCHLCERGGFTEYGKQEGFVGKDGTVVKAGTIRKTDKVRDHCHVTGEYRGAAHNKCNLKARTNYKIPVFFHNLKGYDAHLLFTSIGDVDGKLTVIATNTEKYVSFSIGNLVFKDSMQFMEGGLAKHAKNLPADKFRQTKALAVESGVDLDLLKQKGIYPYSWVDSDEKFAIDSLPPQKAFHNDLENEPCSDEDYKHAQAVWEAAKCKNFGDYHDLYLKLDVALLTDVFENFRNTCHATYGLDPAHYFTFPGFAWSAMLKYTKVEVQLLTDPDMYIAMEEAKRGGVCAVSLRHAKANNPRCDGYDESISDTYIHYLDANNLYGWAMVQKLPIRGFKLGDIGKWNMDRIRAMRDDASHGAFLCVDLEYPPEIHDLHNDFPLCPERMKIPRKWLSPYQEALVGKHYSDCEKLVPNLRDKSKYWIHYRNLKFALEHGLKLKSVHRVLEFQQEAWMKPYIELNTQLRTAATNEAAKDLFKLANNAVFGKTMEDMRRRRDIQALRNDSNSFRKWVAEPTYQGRKVVSENLVIAERAKKKIKLFKPMFVGAAVLDLSKLHMWAFWYDYIKPKYGADARLCYTDTDSLVIAITTKTDPMLEFVGSDGSMFDTSDYAPGHPQQSDDNKKKLGKMKDEAMGVAISEFVGLRPKLYAMRLDAKEHKARQKKGQEIETKKSKGTKKAVVKQEIRFEHYLQTLQTKISMQHSQMGFKTDRHRVYTERIMKTSLSALDTKRWIEPDGITTIAYGHYSHPHVDKVVFDSVRAPPPRPAAVLEDWSKKTCAQHRPTCKGGKYCYHYSKAVDCERAAWMGLHGHPRPVAERSVAKPVCAVIVLAPVVVPLVEVAPVAVATVPKVIYNYIPSTHENRTDWLDQPCALRRKKCKGGSECNHCRGTPRGEWYYTALDERAASMYD